MTLRQLAGLRGHETTSTSSSSSSSSSSSNTSEGCEYDEGGGLESGIESLTHKKMSQEGMFTRVFRGAPGRT
eukprot:5318511-Amphidinium_carterae.1